MIKPLTQPLNQEGAIAVLKGNLAPEGAVLNIQQCLRICKKLYYQQEYLIVKRMLLILF